MKVKDLIKELEKVDPELEVLKAKDDEGNGFHYIEVLDDDSYVPLNEVGNYTIDTVYDLDYVEDELDEYKKFVILW